MAERQSIIVAAFGLPIPKLMMVMPSAVALSMARSKASKSRDMGAIERDLRCRVCGSRRVKCGPVELLPGEGASSDSGATTI